MTINEKSSNPGKVVLLVGTTNDMICHLPFEPRFFGVGLLARAPSYSAVIETVKPGKSAT